MVMTTITTTTTTRTASEKYLSRFRSLLRFPNLVPVAPIHRILALNCDDLSRVIEGHQPYCAASIFVPSEACSLTFTQS